MLQLVLISTNQFVPYIGDKRNCVHDVSFALSGARILGPGEEIHQPIKCVSLPLVSLMRWKIYPGPNHGEGLGSELSIDSQRSVLGGFERLSHHPGSTSGSFDIQIGLVGMVGAVAYT